MEQWKKDILEMAEAIRTNAEEIEKLIMTYGLSLERQLESPEFLERLQFQSKVIADSLWDKGYDRDFRINEGMIGKFDEILVDHFKSYLAGRRTTPLFPAALSTYTHWKDENSDSIQCLFTVDHDPNKGVHITEMNVEKRTKNDQLIGGTKTVPVQSLQQVPLKRQSNAMVDSLKVEKRRRFGRSPL